MDHGSWPEHRRSLQPPVCVRTATGTHRCVESQEARPTCSVRSAPPPSQGEWHKTKLSWGYAACEYACAHVFVSKSQPAPRTPPHLVVTKQRRPTGSIKCLFSPITGCLKRGRVPTLMNKWREKWEGSKLEGKTEESIELWLHTPSLSQTLSNPISRSRLLPSLRLCCYGDVRSRSSCRLRIVSKWGKKRARKTERCAASQGERWSNSES